MKKDRVSSAGFFRLRLLIVTVLCSIGTFLALLASGAKEGFTDALGLADVNTITGTETSPKVTQNQSAIWSHGNTVVVGIQDSSGSSLTPFSFCGVSTSTDGGNTFTRLPEKFNSGGACYGIPSVFYSVRAGKWFMSNLTGRCGSQGIAQWTSADGITWTNGSCIFNGTSADAPNGWVDNNAGSPFYGWQFQAFNNFALANGPLQVARSTDDGITWSSPATLFDASFRRLVKITGSLGTNGTVFVQSMDESTAGGLNGLRQNFIQRSTNGGVTWSTPIAQGGTFLGPGRANCASGGYWVCMYSAPTYWRNMGSGQPGVGPSGVVHYAYSGRPGTGDPGNILYVRSTDNGLTWSAPLQLNTDATVRAQWGPSLSVNAAGKVVVSWYDERNTANDSLERFARVSPDNGATWGPDMALSDVIFPKPLQPDPVFISDYAGIYNFAAFNNDGNGDIAFHAWTDGRVSIAGAPQQDVFIDRIPLGSAPVPTSAVSRKVHGAAGTFDVPLPLVPVNGAVGIEGRVGAAGVHQMVVTFPAAVTVAGVAVTTGVGSATFSVVGNVVTINLTGVTDVQRLAVTLHNVTSGADIGDVIIPMGVLLGDTNGSGAVNATDISQVKGQSGVFSAGSFRSDVNANGAINATDIGIAKGRSGQSLP